jgi:eukaryotic-like serine/threonine-protein kinase
MEPSSAGLNPGTKLGPYDIESLIGAGGMGEVYRARDARLNRTVAIKVLPKSYSADADRLQRFMQEARAAAALNHPNILSIYDIGEEKGSPYIVSELLEGSSLREVLRAGPLATRKAIDYALQITRGLAAAHDKGIVHRDLKPDNIFITEDGRVKILDFGLAKLTRPDAGEAGDTMTAAQVHTEPGHVLGTAGYMAPEQVRGKATDHRADIFSFGSILYEMLSGKRAFRGETAADTMSAILKEEPEELSETGRTVPAALDRIVRHCLEKNPAQRFQSAGDVGFALEALADGSLGSKTGAQAVVSDAAASGTQAAKVESAGRGKALGIAAALAAVAIAGALGWWIGGKNKVEAPEYQQITFRTGSIDNARFAPDGTVIYAASWDGGENQIYMSRTDEPGTRELGLKNAEVLAISNKGEMAIRLNTLYFPGYARVGTLARVPLSGGTPREVLDNVQDADFAEDGTSMAVVRYVTENGHWRLEYPIGKVLLDGINWISHPKISPDGKWIAFADHENPGGDDEGALAVIDMQGHEKKLQSGNVSLQGIVWSPKGDEIWYTASGHGSATNPQAVKLDGKHRTLTNVPGGMWIEDRRGDDILMVTHQQRVAIRGKAPGAKEEKDLGWFGWSVMRDLSQDGKKVLFEEEGEGGGANYTVFLRDTDGSPPVRIGEGLGLAISPDGKWVVTKPKDKGTLSIVPTGAGEARQLTHDNVSYPAARFLPDGKHLIAIGIETGHGVRDYMIDVSSGDSKPITPEGVSGTLVSPDGKSVGVRGPDGKMEIWSLESNSARPIPGLDPKYYATSWSSDGKSIYVGSSLRQEAAADVFKVDVESGKMTPWRKFGGELAAARNVSVPVVVGDGDAYAYVYVQLLSEAYVVRGMR